MFVKTLRWPVISLIITGGVHFVVEAVWPELKNIFVPPVLAGVLLGYGIWVGYKTIQFGGTYFQAIVAAAILGLLPIFLDTVGFGMILGRGVQPGMLAGIFGFSMILWGGLLGGGVAMSK